MTPIERNFDFYLDDMLKSMLRIAEYINGKKFADFKKDYMLVDAVVRNFEINRMPNMNRKNAGTGLTVKGSY